MLARPVGLSLALLALGGCGFFAQKHAETKTLEDSGVAAITYPTELRAAYAVKKDSTARYCAEPPPDVALNTIQKIAADVKATTKSGTEAEGGLSAEASTTALELAGRTQLVLLAREMLYRACELSMNQSELSAADVKDLYTIVAEVVRDFAAADRAAAELRLLEAEIKAGAIIEARQTTIETIVQHVGEADGGIDPDKLKALLEGAESAAFVRDFIEGAADAGDLRSRLRDVSPIVLQDIAAGIE